MTILPEPTYNPIELSNVTATDCTCKNPSNILSFVNLGFNLFYFIVLIIVITIPLTTLKRKVEFLWMRDAQEYQPF